MKLKDYSLIAEIISAIAIVASLIFVGIQLNTSVSAVKSTAASDATATMQSWYLEMGSNRQASDIWLNAMKSPEPLPAHDEFQFLMSMHTVILGMQNSYLLSKQGTLDPEFSEAVTTAIVAVKDLPGMKRFWKQRRGFFHAKFAEHIDGLFARDTIETLDIYKMPDVGSDH
jgi:hypothetical protein